MLLGRSSCQPISLERGPARPLSMGVRFGLTLVWLPRERLLTSTIREKVGVGGCNVSRSRERHPRIALADLRDLQDLQVLLRGGTPSTLV